MALGDSLYHGFGHDEVVRLRYLEWKDDYLTVKPYEVLSQTPENFPKDNFGLTDGCLETIRDIRGLDTAFDLDNHAFSIVSHKLEATELDERSIEQEYLPQMKHLLQTVDPGAEIFFFDWRLRSSSSTRSPLSTNSVVDLDDKTRFLKPVHAVHVDQSQLGGIKRVEHHMGPRAQDLLKRRVRIINLWRPLKHPIENFPLAVCDGSSVPDDKLVAVDHVRKHYIGESLYPLPFDGYRWYYLDRQTKDEVLLFKTFDSQADVAAKCETIAAHIHRSRSRMQMKTPSLERP